MTVKIAFAGFKHGHIFAMYNRITGDKRFEIVAACEEAEKYRKAAEENGVKFTHDTIDAMLKEVSFDVLAVGDAYGLRGGIIIKAMKEKSCHVIADKPLCTTLEEFAQIKALSEEKGLKVGLMLDFRANGNLEALKQAVDQGRLGKINAIAIGGQHPLNYGTRPEWYFQPGMHGGTVNDIAIHSLDAVEYLTGGKITTLCGARTWNAFATEEPAFNDAAQIMYALDTGCGVISDVTYAAPNSWGFAAPFYWRYTVWGSKGVAEFSCFDKCFLQLNGEKETITLETAAGVSDYLDIFVSELDGKEEKFGTRHVLHVTETALRLQALANGSR